MTNKNEIKVQSWNKLRFYSMCGISTLILFFLWLIIAAILVPGYTGSIYISPVNTGFYAMIQNIIFIILGLLIIGLVFGLRIVLPLTQNRLLKFGVWSVVIFSFGVLLAGLLPIMGLVAYNYIVRVPYNLLSGIAFALTFIAYITALLLIGKGLKNENSIIWGRYGKYTFRSGLIYIILLILLILAINFNIYPGLSQRIFFMFSFVWILITGSRLYLISKN
jgi:hypothetical protein